ncbi:MAG: valine--tRNA ligase [Dehalococcoidia bacterium]
MTTTDADPREMATAYDPSQVEERLYEWWEQSRYFEPSGSGDPFTIIMPPPNLTGELHLGHALVVTIEDILTRWHRMLGHDTLWQPGVDHAAIAVNSLVERQLREQGIDPRAIGREAFLEHVWTFVNRARDHISRQHRRLGASAAWEREVFTMDPGPQAAVRETFCSLYEDGLIYRGEYIVNWDPVAQSAISDLEVEHEEVDGAFWHIRYPLLDEHGNRTDGALVVATTRPETMLGDTAVAVNPNDPRHAHLVGRQVWLPLADRAIPVIGDEAVDIESGSGALKVTPGHDPVDFEIGQRHGLPILNIMNPDATLNENAGAYAGLDRFEARKRVVADLEAAGLLERIVPHRHAVGHSQRSGAMVEPLVSMQWYVKIEPLATPAIEAVADGRIKFVPQHFERTYLHWMENIRDWCISRQIWWGHRIPAWYCERCGEVIVAREDPSACPECRSEDLRQDEDTLDTWFSSGLWPHSTLGWPEQTPELDRYYPTQVMETAYDIIFFWVARMIMMSMYNMRHLGPERSIPFDTVYLHGLVRAEDGSKMSKSKGNVIDPLGVIAQYGTDALRYTLISGSSPGNDQRLSDQRLEAGRNFANKLWNASRFVFTLVEDGDDLTLPAPDAVTTVEDRWILSRCERVVTSVDELLKKFELGEAMRQVRDFFWDEFADWYIELAKVRVRNDDRTPLPVLVHVLDRVLRLLHPAMPYVTEEIWQRLVQLQPDANGAEALIVATYPQPEAARLDDEAERTMFALQDFVRAIRNIRAEKRVDAGRWVEAYVVGADATAAARGASDAIEQLARVRPLHVVESAAEAPSDQVVTTVLATGQVVLPMAGLFDLDAERERLRGQIADAEADVARIEAKLANEQFVSRAPEQVVQTERDRLETAKGRLAGLQQSLAEVG